MNPDPPLQLDHDAENRLNNYLQHLLLWEVDNIPSLEQSNAVETHPEADECEDGIGLHTTHRPPRCMCETNRR